MNRRRTYISIVTLGILLSGVWLWIGGCDFNRIEEGTDQHTADLVEKAATAKTPADASEALNLILSKGQVDVPDQQGLYTAIEVDAEYRTLIAEDQAAYVAGDTTKGTTLEAIYSLMKDDRAGDKAALADVVTVFNDELALALEDPETPSASVVVMAASGKTIAPVGTRLTATQKISPVQATMFTIWLSVHAQVMDEYVSMSKNASKAGNITICQNFGKSSQKTLTIKQSEWGKYMRQGCLLGSCSYHAYLGCVARSTAKYLLCVLRCRLRPSCTSGCWNTYQKELYECYVHNQGGAGKK